MNKEQLLSQLALEVALVVKISDEIINGNTAERYVLMENHELKDASKQYFFYYKIIYFDSEGNDITYQINPQKNFWKIDDSIEIAMRDLKTMKPLIDQETKEIKTGNAVTLLREWIKVVPYFSLLEFYIHDLDNDGYFDLAKE